MKTSKEYRVQAQEILKGKYGIAILVDIIFGLIMSAACGTIIVGIILGGMLTVGHTWAYMRLVRSGSMKVGDMFESFNRNDLSSTIGLMIKTAVFTMLWSMLFFVPGIIAAYSYSMAPYILADKPELTGGEAIRMSKELMKGKKWNLFCLEFSYIGWIFLCILTMGILTLWVEPRMTVARTAFYEDIKGELEGRN